ncbi:MAG: hypothetical protein EBX40_04170 [Gammaproteobacteria bacterium]|nr:hypothetical protein [Gammaproteobacteria bacterium]
MPLNHARPAHKFHFKPSKRLQIFLVLAHVVAIIVCAMLPIPLAIKILMAVALCWAGYLALRAHRILLCRTLGFMYGRWWVETSASTRILTLLPTSVVIRGLMSLHFKDEIGKPFRLCVLSDMLSQSEFRTLARHAKLSAGELTH